MEINEIKQILNYNDTNKNLIGKLDEKSYALVADILYNLPSEEFVEINPNAKFSLLDVPLPLDYITKKENINQKEKFSPEIQNEFNNLLQKINNKGTNVEYPYGLLGDQSNNTDYQSFAKMYKDEDIATLENQAVNYDSNWLNSQVSNKDNINVALMHTHPAPLDKQHDTLFNKYPEILSELDVKPSGLNLSLADINTQIVVENAIKNTGKNINFESVVLMHDGSLVSFSTKDGLSLTNQQQLSLQKETLNEDDRFNEFGKITLGERTDTLISSDIPTFTPPEPKIEPVNMEEVQALQKDMFPEKYNNQIKIFEYNNSVKEETEELSKGIWL